MNKGIVYVVQFCARPPTWEDELTYRDLESAKQRLDHCNERWPDIDHRIVKRSFKDEEVVNV